MGKVKSKYNWHNSGRLVFYDDVSFETLWTTYPVQFVEDFLGTAILSDGTTIWNKVDVGAATEAIVADSSNGQFLRVVLGAAYCECASECPELSGHLSMHPRFVQGVRPG